MKLKLSIFAILIFIFFFSQPVYSKENFLLGRWRIGPSCNKEQWVYKKNGEFYSIINENGTLIRNSALINGRYKFSNGILTANAVVKGMKYYEKSKFIKISKNKLLRKAIKITLGGFGGDSPDRIFIRCSNNRYKEISIYKRNKGNPKYLVRRLTKITKTVIYKLKKAKGNCRKANNALFAFNKKIWKMHDNTQLYTTVMDIDDVVLVRFNKTRKEFVKRLIKIVKKCKNHPRFKPSEKKLNFFLALMF